jgi:predicted lipid carrier protein YhbT
MTQPDLADPPIRLPRPLALPLRILPTALHGRLLARLLNHTLAAPLAEGELDLLQGRILEIRIEDIDISYCLTLQQGRLHGCDGPADVRMGGCLHDYLLLLTRREDPDSLFFQRRLSIRGDTGLGLGIKNFLDGLDWDELPLPSFVQPGLAKGLDAYQRLFRRRGY